MSKVIESVPASISRADYIDWFRRCGFEPSNVLSLKFSYRGIFAKVFERDENGAKVINPISGVVINEVFIPVEKPLE